MLYFLKWMFLSAVVLLLIGIVYERISRWRLEQEVFKGRTFASINGRQIHYVKQGGGNCTVIFASGMGSSHQIWSRVQRELSKNCVTLSYDRSGILFSTPAIGKVTNAAVSAELSMLLEQTACPKPYIVVAHSMAGIYLRPFISTHSKDIAGILFIEAANPKQISKADPDLLAVLRHPRAWLIRSAVETGLYRLFYSFVPFSPEISQHDPFQQQEKNFFYRSMSTLIEELDQTETNFEAATLYPSFGSIPLTIMLGTSGLRYQGIKDETIKRKYADWLHETQHELLQLSTSSRLIEAPNSVHLVQVSDGAAVVSAIKELIPKGS